MASAIPGSAAIMDLDQEFSFPVGQGSDRNANPDKSARARRKVPATRHRTLAFRPLTSGPAPPVRKFVSANIRDAIAASRRWRSQLKTQRRVLLVAP